MLCSTLGRGCRPGPERSQQQYGSRVFLQARLLLQRRLARGAAGGPCSGLLPCEPLVDSLP